MSKKLSNKNFVAKAPKELVAKEQTRVKELESLKSDLNQALKRLES